MFCSVVQTDSLTGMVHQGRGGHSKGRERARGSLGRVWRMGVSGGGWEAEGRGPLTSGQRGGTGEAGGWSPRPPCALASGPFSLSCPVEVTTRCEPHMSVGCDLCAHSGAHTTINTAHRAFTLGALRPRDLCSCALALSEAPGWFRAEEGHSAANVS